MTGVMLACGHAANATVDGKPGCAICAGVTPGATEVVATPDLTGRIARCGCGALRPSAPTLAFFEFRGEGSRSAALHCRHCRYYKVAHGEQPCDACEGTGATKWNPRCPRCKGSGVRGNAAILRDPDTNELVPCPGFEAHGAFDYDAWYCGHLGWD